MGAEAPFSDQEESINHFLLTNLINCFMKHKLLFALAGALMSMSAFAADIADPVAPTKPAYPAVTSNWVAPAADGIYYIYNVGAGQFLGTGQSWGTRSLTTNENLLKLTDAVWAVGEGKQTVLPYKLELATDEIEGVEGPWYYIVRQNGSGGQGPYLVHEGNAGWADGSESRREADYNGYWRIEAKGDGSYLLRPYDMVSVLDENGDPTFDEGGNEIKALTTNAFGLHNTNMNDKYALTWTDRPDDATSYVAWKFLDAETPEDAEAILNDEAAKAEYEAALEQYDADMKVYNARVALKTAIEEAEEVGVDISEAVAVYNNSSATEADLQAQNTHLRAAIASLNYDFSGASEANPLDVTDQVLTNPDFEYRDEAGNLISNGVLPPGWTITITGQNLGQQNRTDTNTSTGFAITNFIEAWHPNSLGDGVIAQTVYGLPKGKYVLECDASACHDPANGDGSDIEGVNLFIEAGSNKVTTRVGTARLGIQHFAVTFVNEGSESLTFGLEAIATNANWLSADNFTITYYGETTKTQAYLSLETAIEEGQAIEDNLVGNDIEDASVVNVEASVASNFTEKFAAAQAALGSSDEDMTAAEAELKAAIEEVNKSNALYKQFQEVYNNALLAAQNFKDNNNQWPDLQDEINDWAEVDLAEAFNAGTLTEDDLEEAQGKVDALIAAYLNDPEKIQPGDDLTALIVNADFSQGSGATNIPGWTINSGSITELSASYHNIEAYHRGFDFSQTISNLPAGSYQIGVQGFVRIDSGDNDMVLYAGVSEKKFMVITEESSDEPLLGDGSGTWPADSPNNVLGGYMPNSMQGADIYFNTENPATGKLFYLNTVNIAHAGGDLTIGVKCNATGLWILWDNFTLKYLGSDNLIPLLEEIEEKGIELEDFSTSGFMTDKANELVADLQARIEAADDITSSDDALALISDIKDAIDYIKEGQKLANELMPLVDEYEIMANDQNIDDTAFMALLEELGAKVREDETFADNDEIAKGIEDLKKGWVAAVVNAAEEGDELKGIIINPDFETGNLNSWTDTFTAGNHGFQNNATYSDAEGNTVISNFAESWNNTNYVVDGEISQNIGVLPEGWYQLEVDGYAVNQSQAGGEPEEGVHGVDLFAKTGENIAKQNIGITGETGVSQHWTLGFYSDGVNETTIGVVAQDANCNWTAFDNFVLKYFGETQPVAVEGIAAEATAAPKAIYTLDGRRASTLTRGINIVRKADGSVQKVLVK